MRIGRERRRSLALVRHGVPAVDRRGHDATPPSDQNISRFRYAAHELALLIAWRNAIDEHYGRAGAIVVDACQTPGSSSTTSFVDSTRDRAHVQLTVRLLRHRPRGTSAQHVIGASIAPTCDLGAWGALLHWREVAVGGEGGGMRPRRSRPIPAVPSSAFAGFRFPPEIIVLAVRWYLRYGLSYRDVEELLGERGIEVDHVTIYRWVQRFTPLLADAAGPCRHAVGDRWFVDETYVKVAGKWRYVYRAVDQPGQIIDVYVSARRDFRAARRFFARALRAHGEPVEVVTDRAPALRAAIEGLMPAAFHNTEQYANNRVECDHGRLKARLRPMRGLKRDHTGTGDHPRSRARCRTSAAATTNSASTRALTDASSTRSPNSPERSEPEARTRLGPRASRSDQRNSAREVHQRREERGRRIMKEEFAAMLDAITVRRNRPVRAAC